ncbi:MAG: glutamate--tRNA ligase [Oligoflexia bacterium]|nr:glutamate--tRNA ligase [Oligoflexia bacterium]
MSVRVRFAPSPTGYLHVGGARTALFNYLFAKKHQGAFILRVEDTDQDRNQEQALIPLLNSLKWLGLDWDEGVTIQEKLIKSKGPYAPYRQKERLSIYKEKALALIKKDKAYYCFMSHEEESEQKQKAIKAGRSFRVFSPYRNWTLKSAEEKIQQGQKFCIRFKTPEQNQNYPLADLVRGNLSFPSDSLGDFILIRSDGFPVYNFSCAVDDSLMKISHIFRGEEHLSNTVKQQLIQKALGFSAPQAGHLSIILDKDKKKLSKRSGSESVQHYKKEGYLPSALINFLSLLGWNPKTEKEFFYKKELIESFNIEGLNSSSAVFDEDKLLWLNEEHIKSLSEEELAQALMPFMKNFQTEISELKRLIPALRSGFKTLKQSAQILNLFLEGGFEVKESALEVLGWPSSKKLLESWLDFLKKASKDYLTLEEFKNFQKAVQKERAIKGKEFFMPLRCALMGQPEGVEIKLLVTLLSRDKLIKRAETALKQT